MSNSRTFQ